MLPRGQEIFQLHLHLIPRNAGDGFGLAFPPDYKELPPRAALDRAAAAVGSALASVSGTAPRIAGSARAGRTLADRVQ